jgi:hypothetical protein
VLSAVEPGQDAVAVNPTAVFESEDINLAAASHVLGLHQIPLIIGPTT